MIAPRWLPREEWEARLRNHSSKPIEGKGPLNTAEWWVTDWGFLFTVPIEGADQRCGEMELGRLIADIEESRPPDHPRPPNDSN